MRTDASLVLSIRPRTHAGMVQSSQTKPVQIVCTTGRDDRGLAMELPQTPALDTLVTGHNLHPGTLRDQLGDTPTLLVFLRQFG